MICPTLQRCCYTPGQRAIAAVGLGIDDLLCYQAAQRAQDIVPLLRVHAHAKRPFGKADRLLLLVPAIGFAQEKQQAAVFAGRKARQGQCFKQLVVDARKLTLVEVVVDHKPYLPTHVPSMLASNGCTHPLLVCSPSVARSEEDKSCQ